MSKEPGWEGEVGTRRALESYYRIHAWIYDATRWLFLFGRSELLRRLAVQGEGRVWGRIREVGCGTGRNLREMAVLFPRVQLLGIDLSGAMLERARRNLEGRLDQVDLCLGSYPGESDEFEWGVDAVVFSYALSMFNPGWEGALEAAAGELGEGGIVAVVDFHDTPWGGFRRWMGVNHVRMEGHLLARLRSDFDPIWEEERRAFGGLWRYFLFIGRRKALGDGGARG